MCLLLILQQRQIGHNRELRTLLRRQHQQLELNNRTLREQINDRTHSEQALAESEARQRAILQASSDAIILINRNGLITHVNPAAAKLIGQSAESIEHLPVGSLLTELYSLNVSFEAIAAAREGRPSRPICYAATTGRCRWNCRSAGWKCRTTPSMSPYAVTSACARSRKPR
jgi:PAS domain-containing protein